MNTEQLRQSVRAKWLDYYQQNREWLIRLGVWVNRDGHIRPSAVFILAAMSTLEPDLAQMLPLIVDLSSNPDQIVNALGLNFNPEAELRAIAPSQSVISLPNGKSDDLADATARLLPVDASAHGQTTNGQATAHKTATANRTVTDREMTLEAPVKPEPVSSSKDRYAEADESCRGIRPLGD